MLLIQKSLKKRNPDYIGDKGKKREGKCNRYREAELKCTIDTYLTFYNSQRPHRKLNKLRLLLKTVSIVSPRTKANSQEKMKKVLSFPGVTWFIK